MIIWRWIISFKSIVVDKPIVTTIKYYDCISPKQKFISAKYNVHFRNMMIEQMNSNKPIINGFELAQRQSHNKPFDNTIGLSERELYNRRYNPSIPSKGKAPINHSLSNQWLDIVR